LSTPTILSNLVSAPTSPWRRAVRALHPLALFAAVILLLIVVVALLAPFVGTVDPRALTPAQRLKPPSELAWLGTDQFGRDVWSRVVYGARVSLTVGLAVAVASVLIGTFIGVVAGYIRWLDGVVMRIMDGLMAIPGILLAIALVSLSGASKLTVIVAITIPEVPRVVRLVRSIVLSVREEPFVEAAISVGTPLPKLLWRHVLPNCVPPCRNTPRDAVLGQHDGRGPDLLPHRAPDRAAARVCARPDHPGRERPRRRAPRPAGSEDRQAHRRHTVKGVQRPSPVSLLVRARTGERDGPVA
jgi:ABC-type spermidine/putrescine transport system permease subunit II